MARLSTKTPIDALEKSAIIEACDAFVQDVLRPRFLREIEPTHWNYVIDIRGAYAAGRYRFMQRYRSGFPDNFGEEFDSPFARIDRVAAKRFDIQWMRHTGKWWPLYRNLPLVEALRTIETDGVLHPY